MELGLVNAGGTFKLGLRPVGTEDYNTQVSGGTLGGLFGLRNTSIPELENRLDSLAGTIIRETNRLHLQGVGQDGSFTNLTGWTMSQSTLSELVPPVVPGEFYVRVTDSAGTTVSHSVSVTASSTIGEVAAALAAVGGLSGTSFSGGRLQLIADAGYTFDFLPGVRSTPTFAASDPMAGTDQARPTILLSGQYTGTANQTYTCTVNTEPPGQTLAVGNGVMSLVVTDQNGVAVASVAIGAGYTPGEVIALADGIKISLNVNGISGGYLTGGDGFTVEAIADSDPTGFLAAAGMNVFFSGVDSGSMDLSDNVKNSGRKIAVYRSPDQDNNGNAVLLAKLRDQTFASLGSLSMKDYYRQTVIGLGNDISVTQMQYENADGVLRSLTQQRDAVSGVDINDQASLMMVYERMFQAMARYMNTINETQKAVLTIVS
jgi:flagellar hook-associated protein 1 FlgK